MLRTRLLPVLVAVAAATSVASAATIGDVAVAGDAIAQPLDGSIGDATRGRALLVARDPANCVLCHALADPGVLFAGDVGPPLDGVGRRLTPGQLRLRIVDGTRRDPQSAMPSYYRSEGLSRVAPVWRGKTILTAQQVEDIVAYLTTLR